MSDKTNVLRQAIEAIWNKHGELTPELVVKSAANKKSPLHGLFEWDDKVAGHKFRIEQARGLIQRLTLEVTTERGIVCAPRWVRDPERTPLEQGYQEVVRLATDRDNALVALRSEAARAAAYLNRVHNLAAGLSLEGELDTVLAEFEVFQRQLQTV